MPKVENDVFLSSLGLLYYFSPCEPFSPYAGFGVGGVYYRLKNSPIIVTTTSTKARPLDKAQTDYELNAFIGAEWRIGENWKLKKRIGIPFNIKWKIRWSLWNSIWRWTPWGKW